jgi:hypothetical protein
MQTGTEDSTIILSANFTSFSKQSNGSSKKTHTNGFLQTPSHSYSSSDQNQLLL